MPIFGVRWPRGHQLVIVPDHRPTQRVGIVPDIVVKATVQSIAAGRDEVLDTAVHLIEDSK